MAVRRNRGTKMSKSVRINREALTALGLGMADGLAAIGQRTLDIARPHVPDEPPLGQGLVETGGYVVYIEKKKVAGNATLSRVDKTGVVLYVGFDFPARFNEIGTVHQSARPFLSPAFAQAADDITATLEPFVADRLRAVRPLA